MRRILALVSLIFAAVSSSAAPAQVGGSWPDGPTVVAPFNRWDFGQSLDVLGDADGDGVDDLVVGCNEHAFIVSGASGSILLEVSGSGLFGYDVSGLGDVDGDTVPDFVVGRPSGVGWVHVFSGATGAELYRISSPQSTGMYGRTVEGVGDVTGDGVPDFLVADTYSSADSAYLHSGDTGALHTSIPMNGGDLNGYAFAALPDVSGDQLPDYAIGNYAAYPGGEVKVCSGASGTVLQHWAPTSGGYNLFGASVAAIADFDGDGLADILVGDSGATTAAGWQAGRIEVRSSTTGAVLWQVDSPIAFLGLGWVVTSPGDVDGDGRADVLAGIPILGQEAGGIALLAGSDGSLLNLWRGGSAGDNFGWDLAAGDLDGDGLALDFAAGAPFVNHGFPYGGGEVRFVLRDPFLRPPVAEVSAAAGGTVVLDADFPGAAAGDDYALLLSVTGIGPTTLLGVEVPLSNDPFLQRTFGGDYSMFPSVTNPTGTLDPQGRATITITFGPGDLTPHVGRTAWLAVLASNQGAGTYASAPTRLVVLP